FQSNYPFVSIYDAKTYAFKTKKTLDSGYLGNAPGYIQNYYPPGAPTVKAAATAGVGSCIYETNTQSFWVVMPECYNQTAQLDSFTTFNFTGGTKIQTSNLGSGGDPNALHGCVAEIASYTGNGHNVGDLIAVFDVGGPQAWDAFLNISQQGPNPGFTAGA